MRAWIWTVAILSAVAATPQARAQTLTGQAAFGDWHADAPGLQRLITPADLGAAFATRSAGNAPSVDDPKPGVMPRVPAAFTVTRFAAGLDAPRLMRVAPNGDVFVAETAAGQIRVLRAPDGAAQAAQKEVFASGLDGPFGIAFYPAANPSWVYVATVNQVLRFPYHAGDLHASARPQILVPELAPSTGGHSTRDVQFSPDGTRMFVSIGSASNVAGGMARRDPAAAQAWDAQHGLGAAWGSEEGRALVLSFDPEGHDRRVFATGLRNCVGLAIHPATGDLWCSTNERDDMGDNLPPDYVTRVRQGSFFGWPWYYIGDHQDPRLAGQRPDLAGHVTVPDVLIQPHSAPLETTFYPLHATGPAAFPAAYAGDAFVALHGSWNRGKRTGYKVIRIHLQGGVPEGGYQDFLIGFVSSEDSVWGRPVGVTVAHDGALLVSEDSNGTVWRVAPRAE